MKISISNIAWDKKDDQAVYQILREYGVKGLDVAPARVFEHPFEVTAEEGQVFIDDIAQYGLTPVGMQSLLFGTTNLELLGGSSREAINHLKKMIDYSGKIGITRLVFGSPKNRLIGGVAKEEVDYITKKVFNELGDYAAEKNVLFCIEPNPIAYGADFVTSTMEGIYLVKKINNPGLRLHMDLGTMIINEENIEQVVNEGIMVTEHVHISHPNLNQVIGMEETHKRLYNALKQSNYKGTVAIEMKNSGLPNNIDKVQESVAFISKIYGGSIDE